jgi:hypothetical protein
MSMHIDVSIEMAEPSPLDVGGVGMGLLFPAPPPGTELNLPNLEEKIS